MATLKTIPKLDSFATTFANERVHAPHSSEAEHRWSIEMDELIRRLVAHWLLAAGMVLMPLGAASAASVRVALVGSQGAGVAGGVVALAEAQLSSRGGLEVLDRQHVDRVLKEQKLSVAGLVDAGLAIKAGQLLSVDLFALVEQSADGKETLACIVYDTGTGLRLCDATLSGDGIEAVAGEVVTCVERATQKRAAGMANVKTLSLVGVRNADLPRSLDTMCESLGLLIERELARSGDVALLERKRLGWLQQEQTLTATESDRKLLSSTLQADLQFSRQADGVRATVIVTDAAGRRVHQATAEAKQLDATLLVPLVESVLRGLNAKPLAGSTDRLRESRRFFREAQLRWSFKAHSTAIQAAESALLLDPQQADIQILLAEYLFQQAKDESRKARTFERRADGSQAPRIRMEDYRRVAGQAERAVELYAASFRTIAPATAPALYEYRLRTWSLAAAFGNFRQSLPYQDEIAIEDRAEWEDRQAEFFAAALRVPQQEMTVWHELLRSDPSVAKEFSIATGFVLHSLAHLTRDPRPKTRATIEFIGEWLAEYDRLPVEQRPCEQVRSPLGDISQPSALRPFDAGTLEPFLEHLARHPDPVVRFHGQRGQLFLKWEGQPVKDDDRAIQFRPIRQDVLALLARPEMRNNWPVRRACYEFLYESLTGLSLSAGSPEFLAELKAVCDAMVASGELHVRLIEEWARGSRQLDLLTARPALAALDAGLALSQRTPLALLDSTDVRQTTRRLEQVRAQFLTRWPALREEAGSLRVQTKLLMEFAASPTRWTDTYLCRPIIDRDSVYAVLLTRIRSSAKPEPTLQLVRVALRGGPPTMLGNIAFSAEIGGSYTATRVVTGSCVHDDRLYVATRAGLFEFDLKTPTARLVPVTKSFPTAVVQSVAGFDKTLYAGLEGGYLVSFAPRDETCRVLVSSRRKEKQSPLDDRAAFEIPRLVPDTPRRRLLIHTTTGHPNKGAGELWDYRPESGEFQRRLEFTRFPGDVSNIEQDRLIVSSGAWLVSLDLASDKTFTIANYPLGPQLTPDRKHFIQPVLHDPVQCAGRLWCSQSQGLTGQLRTVTVERLDEQILAVDLPPLDKDEIYAGWYVAPVDNKRFLWSNHHRLWLVTPDETRAR